MVNRMNIALSLSYVGTQYHGWQVQKNGASIQETVTNAINKLLGCDTYLSVIGRTDAGVHARRYVANFKADCRIPLDRLPLALGAQLPEDIAVQWRGTRCRTTSTLGLIAPKRNTPITSTLPKCATRS